MSHLLPYLFFLACPAGMGLMMWTMNRSGSRRQGTPAAQPPAMAPTQQAELTRLRAELDQLRAEDRDRAAPR